MRREKYWEVVADCTEAIAQGHDGAAVFWIRGFAFFHLGDYEKTISDLSDVLQRFPGDLDVLQLRSQAHYLLQDYGKAEADATQVIRGDATRVFAWQLRGSARAHVGQVGAAEEDCLQAQDLAPGSPDTEDCFGDLFLAQGAYGRAAGRYEAALDREPLAARHFAIGLAYLLAGHDEAGLFAYDSGPADAAARELRVALQEIKYWRDRRSEPLPPSSEKALDKVRRRLELALTASGGEGD